MVANIAKVNPRLLQTYFSDLSEDERAEVLAALERELGDASDLWRKFQCNQAVGLFFRTEFGRLAAVSFYELQRNGVGELRFFIRGGARVTATVNVTDTAFPQYEQFARFFQCREMALQTKRAGLVSKIVNRMGWVLDPALINGEFHVRKALQ